MGLLNFCALLVTIIGFVWYRIKYTDIQQRICDKYYTNPVSWSLHSGIQNLNIFYPDSHVSYHGTILCLKDDEHITINSEFPKARYFSFQVYDFKLNSLGSLKDYEIVTNGTNCYNEVCDETNSTNINEFNLTITKNKL